MTNNQLCNLVCGAGFAVACWCFGLVFFGVSSAVWGILVGLIAMALGLFEYE